MKGFLDNVWVQRISWLLIAVGLAGLIATGVTQETINKGIALILAAIIAVSAVVVWIFGKKQADKIAELEGKKPEA